MFERRNLDPLGAAAPPGIQGDPEGQERLRLFGLRAEGATHQVKPARPEQTRAGYPMGGDSHASALPLPAWPWPKNL